MSAAPKTSASPMMPNAALIAGAAHGSGAFPAMTEYEAKVFRRFARGYDAGYHQHSIQLEGDKQLPKVAAAFRLMKKGILTRPSACHWYLTDLGKEMALEWQRQNVRVSDSPGETSTNTTDAR